MRTGWKAPFPTFPYCVHPESHTPAPIVVRLADLDSPHGPVEVKVSVHQTADTEPCVQQTGETPCAPLTCRQGPRPLRIAVDVSIGRIADTEPLLHQTDELPAVPPAGLQGPRSPFIHAFATRLSDLNQRRLNNLCYHSPRGQMKSPVCHINKALTAHLALLKEVNRQMTGFSPLVCREIPRALRTGPKGPPPPFIHALATHLSDANKVELDRLAPSNPSLEGAMDSFVNKALTHHLDRFRASDAYDRGP